MGDGSLHNRADIKLSTQGLDRYSVDRLVRGLMVNFGISAGMSERGEVIIKRRDGGEDFLDMTEPYKVSCFDYKWGM